MTFNHIRSLNSSQISPNPISYSFYFWRTKGTTTATITTQRPPKEKTKQHEKTQVSFVVANYLYAAYPELWLTYSISRHWSVWFSVFQCYHLTTGSLVGVMLCAYFRLSLLGICVVCLCAEPVCASPSSLSSYVSQFCSMWERISSESFTEFGSYSLLCLPHRLLGLERRGRL